MNLLTHSRDKVGDFQSRVLLHIPVGFLIGLFLEDKDLFLEYERDECAHSQDEAWKDIAGALIGFPFGRALVFALLIYLLYSLARWLA